MPTQSWLEIRSPDFPLTPAIRAYTEKHLAARLRRHAQRIQVVIVRFRDVNGTKGGEDKMCRVEVIISGAPVQVVEEVDHDLRAAVDRSANRIDRWVREELAWRRFEPRLIRAFKRLAW